MLTLYFPDNNDVNAHESRTVEIGHNENSDAEQTGWFKVMIYHAV